MFRILLYLSFLFLALTGGCASYPGGVDEKTWNSLPPEKKAELIRLREIHRARLEAERLKLERERAREQAELERQRLRVWRELYQRSGEGVFVRVNFLGGEGHFYKYRPIVPESVTLAIGETRPVTLRDRHDNTLKLWLRYLPGKLWLCSEKPDDFDPRSCATVLDLYWDRGQRAQVDIPTHWDRKHPKARHLQLFIRALGARRCD